MCVLHVCASRRTVCVPGPCVFCVDYGSPGFCLCLWREDTIWAPLVSSGCLFQSLPLYLFFLPTDKQPISAGASSCRVGAQGWFHGPGAWKEHWHPWQRHTHTQTLTHLHPNASVCSRGKREICCFSFALSPPSLPSSCYILVSINGAPCIGELFIFDSLL